MSKKDFELIAGVIKHQQDRWLEANSGRNPMLDATAQEFSDKLAARNPRFDYHRFLKACGTVE